MPLDLAQPATELELMDTVHYPMPVVREALWFLGITAKFFGGSQVVLHHLKTFCEPLGRDRVISILDVGTGRADIPLAIARWARQDKRQVRITAVELIPEVASLAKQNTAGFPEIEIVNADIFSFRERKDSFDFVTASLFLHHVPRLKMVETLQTLDGLCRRGLIISDLERSASGYWAVTALAHFLGNFVVRNDGPLSVRRAFTISELEHLIADADLKYLHAQKEPWFRLSLSGAKS